MTLTAIQTLIIILMVALSTITTRFLPFIIFPDNKEHHSYLTYLGKVLPYSVIGLLVVYCLRGVNLQSPSFGLPEIAAIFSITVLHHWKRNVLLSIGVGTALYMTLVQTVFK
ncbi:MAG: AzlD domain-containing protein [Deltaproteobacteria bacterium]|nr:AzlD domain-containing protein [Deltaproteobacteria bacterium]